MRFRLGLLTGLALLFVACSALSERTATAPVPAPATPAPTTVLEPAPKDTLQVAFLDVGQGDSTLITFPNGKTMLIDGGETDQDLRWWANCVGWACGKLIGWWQHIRTATMSAG